MTGIKSSTCKSSIVEAAVFYFIYFLGTDSFITILAYSGIYYCSFSPFFFNDFWWLQSWFGFQSACYRRNVQYLITKVFQPLSFQQIYLSLCIHTWFDLIASDNENLTEAKKKSNYHTDFIYWWKKMLRCNFELLYLENRKQYQSLETWHRDKIQQSLFYNSKTEMAY